MGRRMENIDLENYRLDLLRRDGAALAVTFEPMTACRRNPSRDRPGWGAKFLRPRTEDVLYVKPMQPNWYRRPDLFGWLDDNAALFTGYDRVILMGGSMGGYGALAFAEVMQATEVLSLNPQSTLSRDLAPWEDRFKGGMAEDWTGAYSDAADTLHGRVYVIADRYEALDWAHVRRLGPNIDFCNFPFVGHRIPEWLMQLGVLKTVSEIVLDGGNPGPEVRRILRRRRELERWWGGLAQSAARSGRLDRLAPFLTPERLANTIAMDPNSPDLKPVRHALYTAVADALRTRGEGNEADDWEAKARAAA